MNQGAAWEYGSDFHWMDFHPVPETAITATAGDAFLYCSTGRDALIHYCRSHLGSKSRVFLPAYYCEDVWVKLSGVFPDRIVFFHDHPGVADDTGVLDATTFREGDVVVRLDYFGLRPIRPWSPSLPSISVISDLTHRVHDLLEQRVATDAFASLRKTFPIPDGGILYPRGRGSELTANREHEQVAAIRMDAMQQKQGFLAKGTPLKSEWRPLFHETETTISPASPASLSAIGQKRLLEIPSKFIFERKRALLNMIYDAIPSEHCLVRPTDCTDPFSLVLLFHNQQDRDHVRNTLLQHRIYPAILWPMSQSYRACVGNEVYQFSDRTLSIPADYRYTEHDVERMLAVLNNILT